MYCTLIKKVNEPKCDQLNKISTNLFTNFIGIGGIDGFVKVVSFDSATKKITPEEPGKPHLRYGQTLICHREDITVLTWNDSYNKLTTCDKTGDIVVWECTKEGNWKEEMTNNRNESYVTDLKWSKQGNFLCFVYGDGHTIVGTVEGIRSWGVELKKLTYLIEWSPDGSGILIAAKNENIIILSSTGQELGELELEPSLKKVKIVTMSWWTNLFSVNRSITCEKHLLIAFENGVVCLYDNEADIDPLIIKTNLTNAISAEWNLIGDVFAICGSLRGRDTFVGISFYSCDGELIRMLKAPDPVVSFSWDSNGTKIALETRDSVYFALVKPKYKWSYFSETLVYSYLNEQEHHTLVYWDVKNNRHNHKYVKNMMDIIASKDFCMITAKISLSTYLLILSNSIGSPLDNKIVNIEPAFLSLNNTHAVISNRHFIYIWQFRALETKNVDEPAAFQGQEIAITLLKKSKMKELVFFIDDNPKLRESYFHNQFNSEKESNDPICSINLSDEFLFVACKSGRLMKYSLADLSSYEKFNIDIRLNKIGTSPNSQYMWGIDDTNHLGVWDTLNTKRSKCEKLKFDKKEVWSVIWSDENSLTFCFLEKNILNVVRDLQIEETFTCNGYLADFSKSTITLIRLEDLMYKPWENLFVVKDIVVKIETSELRKLKNKMSGNTPVEDICNEISNKNKPELWEAVSKESLKKLNFETAEKAMVMNNDLPGLNFVKKIKTIEDENIQKAEIAQYNHDYDNAEEIYNEQNRQDQAVAMRMKLDQWDKVIDIMEKSGVDKEDEKLKISYSRSAEQYMEKKEYAKAEENFQKAENAEGLINVWFLTEQFDKAACYIDRIPEKNEILNIMGNKFESYGLCEEAVNCYLRSGDPKRAIDTCVKMNKWNLAVELAEKNDFFKIDSLVSKFGDILSEKNKKMDLVDLYRKSHRHIDAAKVLMKIGEDFKLLNASPLIIKKIYVIAAFEMEVLKSKNFDIPITKSQNTKVKFNSSINQQATSNSNNLTEKILNNPWKGAEAYHFYMLCQSQLHRNKTKAALKTALRLVLYEKELNPKEVYRLIALCSFMNQSYYECSKAISKLEDNKDLTREEREHYQELALTIFRRVTPENENVKIVKCPTDNCGADISELDINCKKCGSNFSGCVASGQSILHKEYFKCKRCRHKFIKGEVLKNKVKHCPLCHAKLK